MRSLARVVGLCTSVTFACGGTTTSGESRNSGCELGACGGAAPCDGAHCTAGGGGFSNAMGGAGSGGQSAGAGGTVLGTGGGNAGGALPDAGSAGDAGYVIAPPECPMFSVRTRQDASNAPFPVPTGTSALYQCFSYHVDAGREPQAFAVDLNVPDGGGGVLQHLLLYKSQVTEVDGQSAPCIGFRPGGKLIAAWIRGAGSWILPDNVGIELGSSDFVLEAHYDNQTGSEYLSSSGFTLCTGSGRPNTATLSWLGNDVFGGFGIPGIPPNSVNANISGYCMPSLTEPVHIVSSVPWMHRLGRHMNAQINRAAGGTETLLDTPFVFGSAAIHATPALLNPGDGILTTCTFDNPNAFSVGFGEAITSEHCFDLTLAYPPNALVGGGLAVNSCISAPPP